MDWKTILERDGPVAWRAAYRLLGNAADADDCLQDAVLGAMKLALREPIANWRAMLVRMTSARAMDQLRKRYRSRTSKIVEEPAIADLGDAMQLDELRSQLRIALAQLSQEQASAFCLCALEGWSYAEAAEQMQTPVNTIGVLVHRARQQLRDLLHNVDPSSKTTRSHQ